MGQRKYIRFGRENDMGVCCVGGSELIMYYLVVFFVVESVHLGLCTQLGTCALILLNLF